MPLEGDDKLARLVRMLRGAHGGALGSLKWRPRADLYQTPHGWLVKIELAGVEANDIDLDMQGRTVTVRGRRRDVISVEGQRHYAMEIAYSEFERTVELPCDVGAARIVTEHRNGMFLVFISPKVSGS